MIKPVADGWTIDQLARLAGTSVRQVRALQTQGLLPGPTLVGRSGIYSAQHADRLRAIRRMQRDGFSLAGIAVLLRAFDTGMGLEDVVGLHRAPDRSLDAAGEDEDFWGWPDTPKGQLLSVIPTPLRGLSIAS